jgi:hypothetical protein
MSGQTYENSTYIKGKRQHTESMNGQTIVITQCDLRRDLQLMPSSKSWFLGQAKIGNQAGIGGVGFVSGKFAFRVCLNLEDEIEKRASGSLNLILD